MVWLRGSGSGRKKRHAIANLRRIARFQCLSDELRYYPTHGCVPLFRQLLCDQNEIVIQIKGGSHEFILHQASTFLMFDVKCGVTS